TRKGGGTWFGRPDAEPRKLMMNGGPKAGFRGFAAPYLFEPETHTRLLQDFYSLGRTHSLRCSCHEYRLMSFGHAAFCLAAAPKPWDHAAGLLAVTEAGGVAGRLDGAPYQPSRRDIPLITAATPEIFGEVQNKLAWLLPA
ncbi:MAG: inositol monophosphatase family protein, partial [Mangrovicoccus sp.]